jgi:hypothetical protein
MFNTTTNITESSFSLDIKFLVDELSEATIIIGIIECALSVVASLSVMILWFLKFRNHYHTTLVALLCLSDFIMCFVHFWNHLLSLVFKDFPFAYAHRARCVVIAVFSMFGAYSNFVMLCVIALSLFLLITNQKIFGHKRVPLRAILVFYFVTPVIFITIWAGMERIGPISNVRATLCAYAAWHYDSITKGMVVSMGPTVVILTAFTICVLYGMVAYKLYVLSLDEFLPTDKKRRYQRTIYKIFPYPLVFICCWLCYTIWEIEKEINSNISNGVLYIFMIIATEGSGLWNSMVFYFVKYKRLTKEEGTSGSGTSNTPQTAMVPVQN